jgi:predicted DNA binding CopG/RHH family protein
VYIKEHDNTMKRTNIYLAERQIEQLKIVAAQDNMNVAELLRRAIDMYLDHTYEKQEREKCYLNAIKN